MPFCRILPAVLLFAVLSACNSEPEKAPAIGEGYVAPAQLNLRKELAPGTPVAAALKHGDRLDILQRRRRFVKVRTAKGIEGWTDSRQLLTREQMDELRRASEKSSNLPSMGVASVYDALNVHTEPSRTSPSFAQIPEGGKVEVIGHKVTPRIQAPPPSADPPRPAKKTKKKEKEADRNKVPPPPPPPAPKLPPDWIERSRSPIALEVVQKPEEPPPPVKLDDWSLVRTKDRKVGWVLSRQLTMAIPDEVAQYAEGHRITSYFSLGDVPVDDQMKHHWLWTTIASNGAPYDFDSFRVFIWSLRHHRYETAYIERNVTGFFPVEVKPGAEPRFSLILRDREDNLYRKTFSFNGIRAQFVSKEPYEALPETESKAPESTTAAEGTKPAVESLFARAKKKVSQWKARVFGK